MESNTYLGRGCVYGIVLLLLLMRDENGLERKGFLTYILFRFIRW